MPLLMGSPNGPVCMKLRKYPNEKVSGAEAAM